MIMAIYYLKIYRDFLLYKVIFFIIIKDYNKNFILILNINCPIKNLFLGWMGKNFDAFLIN